MGNEPRHTKGDLAQMQSLPLSAKILMAKRRIREWYEHFDGQVYVSFSGGKDSTVLKHLVDSIYDDVPAVFVNTGLEYPEIQNFVREVKAGKFDCFNTDVEILRPKMRFDEVVQKYGYPVIGKKQANVIELARNNLLQGKYSLRLRTLGISAEEAAEMGLEMPSAEMLERYEKTSYRSKFTIYKYRYLLDAPFKISNKCCDVMKKKPAFIYHKQTGRKPLIATMASESMIRESAWLKHGCNAFEAKHPASQPMSFWTEQDVLHYIKQFDVPYCPVYGEVRIDDRAAEFEGQINMIDFLGSYEPGDRLKTTGCDRTGCMFCMFGCHIEKEPNRFQRMKITHPVQYKYCMENLGLKEVLEYIGVPYE